jgi:hypothetical protein
MAVPFRLLALAIGLATIAPFSPSVAATIRVPSQQPTIQQGITAAANGDTVLIAPGTYTGPSNRNLSFLNKDLVLRSEQGPTVTTIDCQSLGRGFILLDAESPMVRGITIKNGAGDSGAGIFCVGAQPEIVNCVFRNNVATERGGGLCCVWSSVELDSCQFIDNTARVNGFQGTGGGIYVENSTLTVAHGSFVNNLTGTRGGGMRSHGATLHVTDCLFQLNRSSDGSGGAMALDAFTSGSTASCRFIDNVAPFGGAIVSDFSAHIFSSCRFEDNLAGQAFECTGGAVQCGLDASLTFRDCLFSGNSADDIKETGNGGAIYVDQRGQAELNHCTLYNNRASIGDFFPGHGSGLFVRGQAFLRNTIIAFSPEAEAVYCSGDGNVTAECCDIYGNDGGDWVGCLADLDGTDGNISEGPFFCDPENGDFGLAHFSPCAPDHSPGECGLIGAYGVACASPVGIAEPHAAAMVPLRIWNYPNPFNPSTTIVYQLPSPGLVTLTLFDVSGRWVRGLVDNQPTGPGEHRMGWDGTDDAGRPMESGVYFGHLKIDANEEVRRLVLVK